MTRPDAVVVDVHAHAMFPAVEATAAEQPGHARQREMELRGSGAESAAVNQAQLSQIGPPLTNPAQRLAAMDHAGVDVQVVSPMPLTTTGRTRHSQDGSRGSPTKA